MAIGVDDTITSSSLDQVVRVPFPNSLRQPGHSSTVRSRVGKLHLVHHCISSSQCFSGSSVF